MPPLCRSSFSPSHTSLDPVLNRDMLGGVLPPTFNSVLGEEDRRMKKGNKSKKNGSSSRQRMAGLLLRGRFEQSNSLSADAGVRA